MKSRLAALVALATVATVSAAPPETTTPPAPEYLRKALEESDRSAAGSAGRLDALRRKAATLRGDRMADLAVQIRDLGGREHAAHDELLRLEDEAKKARDRWVEARIRLGVARERLADLNAR